jgi:pullulanase/glycogen debranching enzyme
MKVLIIILGVIFAGNLSGQSFTEEEKMQGYSVTKDQVVFVFDQTLYRVNPQKVVVTGNFRNWNQDMNNDDWQMKKSNDLWVLKVNNEDFSSIRPNDEFKYRIDDGEWLSPPKEADNEQGGNLVFMKDHEMPGLKAELKNAHTIWAKVTGQRPLSKEAYRVTDAAGNEVPIAGVLPNTSEGTLISTAEPMDIKRVYFLEIPELDLRTNCRYDGWFRLMYSDKELGANVEGNSTVIRIFAPRAEMVKVYLYKGKDDKQAFRVDEMEVDESGVWEATYEENLKGTYYDFTIHGASDPGNHFYETNPVHITDPYARVSDNTWGKARIWSKTTPASPLENGIPEMQDIISYEVHVQDFTDLLPVEDKYKGRFKAMTMPGLKNSRGEKIGFDYLVDLGINVVHLMPVQEYLHFPDDDWKESFKNDQYMIEQGVSEENYQWGYRTSHFFAVESKYRTLGEEPGTERDEFRDLVQAFHDKGIAVIIDIVPNHTAENMDGNELYFNFNAIDKQYYYRTKDFDHIGEYGNEVKTENRPMVQRWLIDQCKAFIEEFGIDGFRIDLAGQIDEQSLKAIKAALGPEIIVYGEPWIGSNDPEFEANPDWDWYKEDSPITFFQDDARNAFKGPVFDLADKTKDRGWPGGKYDERENVMKGLANKFPEDKTPLSGINYLDIHDNFALADQFGTEDFDGRYAVDQDLYKIAVTLLYTSVGPIVTHGGSELMRSKASAPLMEVVKETNAGFKIYMHGKRDTYNHRAANHFVWENVGTEPQGDNKNDYKNMHAFWKGMNDFRLSDYGKVFRVSEAVPEGYYQWITPEDESMLGYIVDSKVFVLINTGSEQSEFENVKLPEGDWLLIANNQKVDFKKGVKGDKKVRKLKGGTHSITMEPESLLIWVKQD